MSTIPRTLLTARRRFFDAGMLPTDLVAAPILRSWQRCAGLGFDGERAPRVEPLSAGELRQAVERNEMLRRSSRPEMETLYADATATDSIVILTDASGLIIDTMGSTAFAAAAARVSLKPGVSWSEAVTGTNAIGTALVERQPTEVRGSEHFFAPHGFLSCSAAPIFGPRGELLGALDLSGNAAVHHVHALGLVRLAVDQIEHRLFERGFEHCDVLRIHTAPEMLGTQREGILVFEGPRLIAANRYGLDLVHGGRERLGQARWEDLFDTGIGALAGRWQLRRRDGLVLHARLQLAPSRPAASTRPARRPASAEPVFDAATTAALARAVRLLDADVPVLVQGETGSGKEVFARAVHRSSARAARSFVAVNCAALPESLIESELFGYEEGAFTGARRHGSKGLLREADGGTLFLDEIGDMPVALQARLLRVIQEREVMPVGGVRAIPVDFALICATHRRLRDLVADDGFRSDLYFRIAQYTVELPPLRSFADRHSLVRSLWTGLGGDAAGIALSSECARRLADYDWPGNYRQLAGVLRALLVLATPGQEVPLDALPPELREFDRRERSSAAVDDPAGGDTHLKSITHEAMRRSLDACRGNVSHAAKHLGISRSTLYRRLFPGGATR